MSAKVAFIGLGVMGFPMAGHLKAKGYDVVVYNRTGAKAEQWAQKHGGKSAPTPAAAAKDADFVMTMVGNDNDVEQVCMGKDGVLAGMKKGAILIDHTTASADVARKVYAAAKEKGIAFIDAPVSGGQAGAENGKLTVMCGGEGAPFERAKPVMDSYGRAVTLLGPAGAGQLTKMVNQICIVGLAQALAEALAFAKRNDLDLEKVIAVISKGAAQSWQMDNRWKPMSEGKTEGFGFATEWMRKDMGICFAQAKASNASLPVAALVDQFYSRLEARGGKRWDSTAGLVQLLLKD